MGSATYCGDGNGVTPCPIFKNIESPGESVTTQIKTRSNPPNSFSRIRARKIRHPRSQNCEAAKPFTYSSNKYENYNFCKETNFKMFFDNHLNVITTTNKIERDKGKNIVDI